MVLFCTVRAAFLTFFPLILVTFEIFIIMANNHIKFFNSSRCLNTLLSDKEAELLVYKVINRVKLKNVNAAQLSCSDLFEAGFKGLVKAATLFDKSREIAFSTFAYRLIHNEICNSSKQLVTKEKALTSCLRRDDEAGMSNIINLFPSGITADADLLLEELKQDIKRVLYNLLGDRDAEIVLQRFGIFGKEKSCEELAAELHLGGERIRQIVKSGILKIRENGAACKVLSKYRSAS